jgi:hypothetical protein
MNHSTTAIALNRMSFRGHEVTVAIAVMVLRATYSSNTTPTRKMIKMVLTDHGIGLNMITQRVRSQLRSCVQFVVQRYNLESRYRISGGHSAGISTNGPKHKQATGGDEKAFSYPVISNGRLYIRDLGTLWAYDIKARP